MKIDSLANKKQFITKNRALKTFSDDRGLTTKIISCEFLDKTQTAKLIPTNVKRI